MSVTKPTQCDGLAVDSVSHSSVGEYYQMVSNAKHVIEGQNAVNAQGNGAPVQVVLANEMNPKSSTTDTLDIFKNKAAKIGIKVQEATDSGVNREENSRGTRTITSEGAEPEQSGENPAQSCVKTVMEMNGLAAGAKDPELALGSETLSESDSELEVFNFGQDVDVKKTEPRRVTCGDGVSDSKSNLEELSFKPGVSEETGVTNTCNMKNKVTDKVTTTEKTSNTEQASTISLEEDPQIVAFEEIARQNGIKVSSAPSASVEEVKGNTAATDNTDIWHRYLDWLNEIEDGEKNTNSLTDSADVLQRYSTWLKHTCNEIPGVGEKNTLSGSSSESFESVTTEDVQETEYWTDTPFEEDPQLARFQELARLKGIKVSGNKLSNSSSSSSLSPATSIEQLCHPGDEIRHMVTGDIFENLAKRNGIKIGKPVVSTVKSLQRATIVYSQASTQTEIATVDCHSQTCEKDHGLVIRQTAEVQVDAVREAFEEEFVLWKLDENATGDSEELCYKELYFEERKALEELTESLHNEKDVSANTKHNHKRVMEQLKEELSNKTEETEVHTIQYNIYYLLLYLLHVLTVPVKCKLTVLTRNSILFTKILQ